MWSRNLSPGCSSSREAPSPCWTDSTRARALPTPPSKSRSSRPLQLCSGRQNCCKNGNARCPFVSRQLGSIVADLGHVFLDSVRRCSLLPPRDFDHCVSTSGSSSSCRAYNANPAPVPRVPDGAAAHLPRPVLGQVV